MVEDGSVEKVLEKRGKTYGSYTLVKDCRAIRNEAYLRVIHTI